MVEHLGNRAVLNMDQLAEMKDLRPRCETPQGIKLPGDSRGNKNRIWFFSIDGTLRGNRFTGALMAGECIMVQAPSFEAAFRIARDGLNDTPELAREYLEEAARSIVVASPYDASHMMVDVGGRRQRPAEHPAALHIDQKLRAMIEDVFRKRRKG